MTRILTTSLGAKTTTNRIQCVANARRSSAWLIERRSVACVRQPACRAANRKPIRKGRDVGIPYGSGPETCPVRALTAWKTAAGIAEGALFRGGDRHGRMGANRLHKDSVGLVV